MISNCASVMIGRSSSSVSSQFTWRFTLIQGRGGRVYWFNGGLTWWLESKNNSCGTARVGADLVICEDFLIS